MENPTPRKPYPTDVTDEEWAFVAPYLTLLDLAAPQRRHDLREVLNAFCAGSCGRGPRVGCCRPTSQLAQVRRMRARPVRV